MEKNNTAFTPEMLSQLQRDDLRELLIKELAKDTVDIDEVFVRQLLEEMEDRGKDPAFADDSAVEAACEKYREVVEGNKNHRKHWYQSWMLKVASVVLVLGILFFALPGAAEADDVQGVLTWWSDSVFQFFRPGEQPLIQEYVYKTDHPGLQHIYDTVTELGVADPVVPRWVPDSVELIELKTYQMAEDYSLYARFTSKERNILFTAIIHSKKTAFQHEKDDKNIVIWDMAGNEHYVLSNKNERIVTWIADGIECTITTDCPEEEVYRMIKSIYTLEG